MTSEGNVAQPHAGDLITADNRCARCYSFIEQVMSEPLEAKHQAGWRPLSLIIELRPCGHTSIAVIGYTI